MRLRMRCCAGSLVSMKDVLDDAKTFWPALVLCKWFLYMSSFITLIFVGYGLLNSTAVVDFFFAPGMYEASYLKACMTRTF